MLIWRLLQNRNQASGEENDLVTPYGKLTPRNKPGLVPIIVTIYPADPCLVAFNGLDVLHSLPSLSFR